LGTALTDLQLELAISPLLAGAPSRTLVLALDADEAGQQATRRLFESGSLARLNARGIDVRIATMPTPYKDPDK
jgi:DNA primase